MVNTYSLSIIWYNNAVRYAARIARRGRKEINMNSVNIIGRLVNTPELKKTGDGLSICDLRFAVDDTFSKENRTDFINVTVFGNQADVCERYLRKGFMAGVSGRIKADTYTGADGTNRYPVKVIAERIQFLQWPDREKSAESVESAESIESAEAV